MTEIYTVECSEIMQRCATGNTALEQIGHNVGEKCTVPNQFFSKASNRKNYCCFCSYEKLVWYCTCFPHNAGQKMFNYLGLSHGG